MACENNSRTVISFLAAKDSDFFLQRVPKYAVFGGKMNRIVGSNFASEPSTKETEARTDRVTIDFLILRRVK